MPSMQYIDRETTRLRPPKRGSVPLRKPQGVMLHCTGGKHSSDLARSMMIVRQVQAYHQSKGWKDAGYHWFVDDAGNVLEGRGWDVRGSHAGAKYNATHHACAYLGDGKSPTPEALDAIGRVLAEHESRYGTSDHRGHCEVTRKSCPGPGVMAWLRVRRGH